MRLPCGAGSPRLTSENIPSYSPRMNRQCVMLRHLDPAGVGLEIGPSYNPVAPKREGFNVETIDCMDRDQLVEKYRAHGIDVGQIEAVDYVWRGESYARLTGKAKAYDWIVASHVVEHAPDLVGFLNDCASLLRDDGVLSLAIPDKRFCFDCFRPVTSLGAVVDAHFQDRKTHTPGSVAESYLNAVSMDGRIAWSREAHGAFFPVHSADHARDGMRSVADDNAVLDVHAWCFVPSSFRLLLHDLFVLGLIPLREISFAPTIGCEFYVVLGRKGKGPGTSRLELLETVRQEESSVPRARGPVAKAMHSARAVLSRAAGRLSQLAAGQRPPRPPAPG
jgi:predicted SAM-dependent methyltransferase